jgi:hypothetical protein
MLYCIVNMYNIINYIYYKHNIEDFYFYFSAHNNIWNYRYDMVLYLYIGAK